jgi:hypothetical protein
MKVKDKETGEVIDLGKEAYEVVGGFVIPLRYLSKEDYDLVIEKENK